MAKKAGRRTLEPSGSLQKHQLTATVSEEFLAMLDDWRRQQDDVPNRTEALRRLTSLALESEAKKKGGKK
jgi:hypothetical protein